MSYLQRSARFLHSRLTEKFSVSSKMSRTNYTAEINTSESPTKAAPDGRRLKNTRATTSLQTARTRKRFAKQRAALSGRLRTRPVLHPIKGTSLQRLLFVLTSLLVMAVFSTVDISNFQYSPFQFNMDSRHFGATRDNHRRSTSVTHAGSTDTGRTGAPSNPIPAQTQTANSSNDKYFSDFSINLQDNSINSSYFVLLEQIRFLENSQTVNENKGVKGSLARNSVFWEYINAPEFVLDIVKTGYVIPFNETPPRLFSKNNQSALKHADFVTEAIEDLVSNGCAKKVPFKPYIVSPLTVSVNQSNKKRLILDLRLVNFFVRKEKIKFEDWNTALQLFKNDSLLFKFDLRSGYHHVDICCQQQTFLGFQWKNDFYCFTVLPFGLCSSGYIFTKVLRPLVRYWRENGTNLILYLDDGLGITSQENSAHDSSFVRITLIKAGFLINEEKSIFKPCKSLEWLGLRWNANDYTISISEKRIVSTKIAISDFLKSLPKVSARLLAQITGKIISLLPVVGNVARLMTKFCLMEIENRSSWDALLKLKFKDSIVAELNFWLQNISSLNTRKLTNYTAKKTLVFSDASNFASGAFSINVDNFIFHQMWSDWEKAQSSTWREIKAVELALFSFQHDLKDTNVKWFTDSQNCMRIIQAGSMKLDLQILAYSIFTICLNNNISLELDWIPRSENEKADFLSKLVDYDDWGITDEFFDFLNGMWGPFSVDRFASHYNTKLQRFNSKYWCPKTEAVDAFTQNWKGENNWLVPPVSLIIKTIKHVLFCKARATLIVPNWRSSLFWTFIFESEGIRQPYIRDVLVFKDTDRIFSVGRNKNTLFAPNRYKGSVLALKFFW